MSEPALVCECGCGREVGTPPRGGYSRVLQRDYWFATNECMARYESERLKSAAASSIERQP